MNGGGGSELAVIRKIGLGWKVFNSMSSMLCGKRHTWNIKGKIYKTCMRPVMTYGSKTWVVRSVEILFKKSRKTYAFNDFWYEYNGVDG